MPTCAAATTLIRAAPADALPTPRRHAPTSVAIHTAQRLGTAMKRAEGGAQPLAAIATVQIAAQTTVTLPQTGVRSTASWMRILRTIVDESVARATGSLASKSGLLQPSACHTQLPVGAVRSRVMFFCCVVVVVLCSMLEVGNGMSTLEDESHFTLWAM